MKDFYIRNKYKIIILIMLTLFAFLSLNIPYFNIVSSRITSAIIIGMLVLYVIVFSISPRILFLVSTILFISMPLLVIFGQNFASDFFGLVFYTLLTIGIVKIFVTYLKHI